MQSSTKFFSPIVLMVLFCGPVCAADPAPSSDGITIVARNIDGIYSDLNSMLSAAGEPKAWDTLRDYLDGFVEGMERSKTIIGRIRMRTEKNGKKKYQTIWQFPVTESGAKSFLLNIDLLDYKSKKLPGSRDTYRVSGSYIGYLKFIGEYACFAENRDELSDELKSSPELVKLLGPKSDAVVVVNNEADGLDGRREALETTYKEVIGGINKRKNEDPDRFELRKLWTEQQMAEINRFVAESSHIKIDWTGDSDSKNGEMLIDLEALPGTPLAESVSELGKTPSLFRNVPHLDSVVCSLHVNFPLDELRKKNGRSMATASKSLTLKEIQKNKELSDQEKQNATNISEVLYDAVDQVVETGILDCFLNVTTSDSGVSQAVGGIRLNGNLIKNSIESHKGMLDLKLSVEKEGNVEIHTLTVPQNWKSFRELFGNAEVIYLATSEDAFWYSIGEGGSARIHEAIRQTRETGDKTIPAVLVDARMSKLIEVLDKVQSELKEGDAQFRSEMLKLMSTADDTFHLLIDRKDSKVNLEMKIREGVFLGAGKVVAKGVRENFD